MRAYWAIFSARFWMLLQYRAAALAGFSTQFFWGLIRVMIFGAFYQSAAGSQPMSYPEVVTYVWLSQAMLGLQPWSVDPETRQMIRTGAVAYELLRPLDLYNLWFARAIAQRTAPTVLRAIPLLIIAGLFLGLQPPGSVASGAAAFVSLAAALFLSCAITTITAISMLWTISGDGIGRLMFCAVVCLSGMVLPIPLFPDWSQAVLKALPFRGLVDTPFRIYSGSIPVEQALPAIAHQVVWTVVIVLIGRAILSRHVHRLVVQGG